MIIIENNIIPFGSFTTMNFFGILFTKNKNGLSKKTINHESIHSEQLKELIVATFIILLILKLIFNFSSWYLLFAIPSFYIWYGIEYTIIRFLRKRKDDVYHDVSFEEEAYNNCYDFEYLKNRKHFCWFKYLSPFSNSKDK